MVSTTQRQDEGFPSCSSLVELLQWRASHQPDQVAYRFLFDGESEAATLTYAQLGLQARAIAAVLQRSEAKNERALLLFPPGLDYIASWFGCLYANVVAVPAYPPRAGRSKARIAAIVDDSEPSFVLTTEATREREAAVSGQIPGLRRAKWVVPARDVSLSDAGQWTGPAATGATVAFLQYTSGSTSSPKGVIVSHANLLHNLAAAHEAFGYSRASSGVSWLPPYHDMGLIGGILHPLYGGFPVVLMPPVAFLQRPARWLEAISENRASVSAGPNSAYRLCARRITDEDKAGIDLSNWEVAFNGSEPVRGDVLDEFSAAFRSCGFRREAFYPCYGLAEATLLVSGKQDDGDARRWWVQDLALQQGRAVTVDRQDGHGQLLVSSGQPAPGVRVVIADPQTQTTCGPGQIGEIWVEGPGVTGGYWGRPDSPGTFHAHLADVAEADVGENGGYLRTGDLGVMEDGHLYVTGRLSDLIIIRGKNHYPQDIERTVEESHPALQPDRGAAFSVDVDGEERLVVVHEAPGRKDRAGELAAILDVIRHDVVEEHQIRPYAVALIRSHSMPRTSSGKVQRRACRAAFIAGDLEVVVDWRDRRDDGTDQPVAKGALPSVNSLVHNGREQRATEIQAWLAGAIAERLGTDVAEVDVGQPFSHCGLDSVDAVALSGDLARWLGRPVEPTLAWDYPTIASAAHYLASEPGDPANSPQRASYNGEPIAVIGMGCRFPGGVGSVEAFWEFLRTGQCGVAEVPADRWDINAFYDPDPRASGKMATRYGAFIDGVDQFDPLFFGISPREANFMDPQQRVLLEVAWEALEKAGIAADDLTGSSTGAFIGISTTDYAMQFVGRDIDAFVGTGNAHSIAANRLSYVLGLQGPSMAVDTACSSSLVAVHLACQSLRAGECDLALAGGVNLLLLAETMVNFSQARMLAADGRCKTFDAAADGYGRGEGCGVVVLRRLSDAIASGGPVLAVVRGSAVNHDGRSNGLTAPNGPAQEEVIRQALAAAGVDPLDVGYVEAHGTGTPLGDPIEVRALGRVLAAGRDRSHPLVVGSVKTNLGHLEAAAGVAGLMKAVLMVQRGEIPAHLHFQEPNAHIPWDDLAVEVPTEHRLWDGQPRIAGVSSFGFGGTNAHVVIEEPPELAGSASPPAPGGTVTLVKVAARNPAAARAAASRLAEFAESHPDVALSAVAYEAGVGRADLPERIAVVAGTPAGLAGALREAAAGRPAPGLYRGRARPGGAPPVGFVVPGQGSRLAGAAEQLYGTEAAFSAVIDELAEVLGPLDQFPLAAILRPGPASEEALAGTDVAQPAGYALALGLAAWWREAGVEPAVVVGHSVGAYAAAALAGVLSPLDGARLVAARGRLMAELCPPGAMAAIAAPGPVVTAARRYDPAHLAIAAVNTPTETVVSGAAGPLEALVAELSAQGISCQLLRVNRAFHSPLVEPALDALAAELAAVHLGPGGQGFISDTTGAPAGPDAATTAYWVNHSRRPVQFATALQALYELGARALVELGPGTTLLSMARATLPADGLSLLPSLHAGTDPRHRLRSSLAELWARGQRVDWRALTGPPPREHPGLPTYPFQRQRHWLPDAGTVETAPLPGPPAPATGVVATAAPATGVVATGGAGTTSTTWALDVAAGEGAPGQWSEIVQQLLDTPSEERRAVLFSHVRREVASVIGLQSPDLLAADQGLFDLGVDSLMAVDLARRLERALGRQLPTTLAIDHPTVDALTDHLLELGTSLHLFHGASGAPAPATTFVDEPIAIVGMGCRFPGGADSPQQFWDLLRTGTDAIVDVPPSRWEASAFYDPDPDAPLKMYTSKGGFLSGPVDEFDAETFGIAPREAMAMDPQQRLLLEVTWEALEDAGMPVGGLVGSSTGVYVGINTGDYMQLLSTSGLPDIDAYVATGNTFSVAAGRLSYLFGLQGPSMAIDTACSSSLVAADLACRSLHQRHVDLALVGGVNLMLSPATSISLAKMRALAPDGRCKAFDATADGYGRGEGCGVVVLKRLSDALADGDRVWATIRGTAVNQDGRSAGLTVPNGPAQQALIRDALGSGAIAPQMVDYVEAHGTGTPLGDPVELQALAAVLGDERDEDRPLLVGSVKTNIGHLEAAAGIAGLIKLALAIHYGEIPPHLHFLHPNQYVDWDRLPVTVPTTLAEWPKHRGPRIGAVSSFGFSGTNAHIVMGDAPLGTVGEPAAFVDKGLDWPQLLLLTGRSPEARVGLAAKYRDMLVGVAGAPDESERFAGICNATAISRSHHDYRLAIVASSAADAADSISNWQKNSPVAGVHSGRVTGPPPRLLWVFSGQGAQRPRMGVDLLDEPVFRTTFMACDEIVRERAGWSPLEELLANEPRSRLEDTEIAQPVVFAVQAGLVALWKAWSVEPDAVTGHSVGEIAAAFVAGTLDLEDAVRIVLERGRLMQPAKGAGRMAVLGLPPAAVEELLLELDGQLSIAAFNGPRSTVVTGPAIYIDKVVEAVRARHLFCRALPGPYAFHSPDMASAAASLGGNLNWLRPKPPAIPLFSTVTGQLVEHALGGDHWGDNVRLPVQFASAVRSAIEAGPTVALEIGPHPVLATDLRQLLGRDDTSGSVLASMERGRDSREVALGSLGALYVAGFGLDHARRCSRPRLSVPLPTYAWHRTRYWMAGARAGGPNAKAEERALGGYAMLGRRFVSLRASGERYFEVEVGPQDHPELFRDRIEGVPLLPLSTAVELALASARHEMGGTSFVVRDFRTPNDIVLPDGEGVTMQLVMAPDDDSDYKIELFAARSDQGTTPLASAWVVRDGPEKPEKLPEARKPDWTEKPHWTEKVPSDMEPPRQVKARLDEIAVLDRPTIPGNGPASSVERVWTGPGEALAMIRTEDAAPSRGTYIANPALLTRALELLGIAAGAGGDLVLSGFRRLKVKRSFGDTIWAHARVVPSGPNPVSGELRIWDRSEELLAEFDGAELRPCDPGAVRIALRHNLEGLLYGAEWQAATSSSDVFATSAAVRDESPGTWLVYGSEGDFVDELTETLAQQGHHVVVAEATSTSAQTSHASGLDRRRRSVDPTRPGDVAALVSDLAGADQAGTGQAGAGQAGAGQAGAGSPPFRGVLFIGMPATEASDLWLDHVDRSCGGLLHLVQALVNHKDDTSARLWIVTRGTQPVRSDGPAVSAALAPLWGLGRVIALEHPEVWGGMIDLEHERRPEDVSHVLAEVDASDSEDQVAYRLGTRYVLRLARQKGGADADAEISLRPDASYLITGGRGALGLKIANWMAGRGARHLVLTGRQPVPDRADWPAIDRDGKEGALVAAIGSLEAQGVAVHTPTADVTKASDMAAIFRSSPSSWPPVRGVVHAAGMFRPNALVDMTFEELCSVLAPKVRGSWVVHELTRDIDLDFFVLFSSAAATWGSALAGHYVAANHFEDVLAHHRRALGLPALSVNWGWWAGSEMVAPEVQTYFSALGLDVVPEALGFVALEHLMASGATQRTVAPVDWSRFKPIYEAKRRRPLLDLIESTSATSPTVMSDEGQDLARRLRQADVPARPGLVMQFVQRKIREVLKLPSSSAIDPHMGFFESGMDSITSVELKTRLESALGTVLPATIAFEYPNVHDLSTYLLEDVLQTSAGPEEVLTDVSSEDQLDELSEEELFMVLSRELAGS